ncbi:NACHT, LRR and PYD domains-containing protein 1b allele 2 isoform 3-T3 [Anableps anableps]
MVDEEESAHGSKIILKPGKQESLEILDSFNLTTDADNAEIEPETVRLGYDSGIYFEVFIRNADSDFSLRLITEKKDDGDTIWKRTIRRGDYRSGNSDNTQNEHFIDRHRTALIQRVKDIKHILDKLLEVGLIRQEKYDTIRKIATEYDQMRDILKIVTAAGKGGKDAFLKILKGTRSLKPLLAELEKCS